MTDHSAIKSGENRSNRSADLPEFPVTRRTRISAKWFGVQNSLLKHKINLEPNRSDNRYTNENGMDSDASKPVLCNQGGSGGDKVGNRRNVNQ